MSMFLDSSRTLPDTKEGLGNPDMSGILLDSPTLLLSWPSGKAGFEAWVLSKGGLVSVHHSRQFCTVVHAHLVRVTTLRP